ncbi:hypothetical protein EfmGK923_10360 [Enterococcus faecium]|nr:hypothetical protein EfmGK923_10360 [Enterococcus faecium]
MLVEAFLQSVYMLDYVQLNGHELSYYNDQKIWCTGHSQTMINAYDFIHSDVPEIDPLGFKENTVNMLLILSQSGDEYYHDSDLTGKSHLGH